MPVSLVQPLNNCEHDVLVLKSSMACISPSYEVGHPPNHPIVGTYSDCLTVTSLNPIYPSSAVTTCSLSFGCTILDCKPLRSVGRMSSESDLFVAASSALLAVNSSAVADWSWQVSARVLLLSASALLLVARELLVSMSGSNCCGVAPISTSSVLPISIVMSAIVSMRLERWNERWRKRHRISFVVACRCRTLRG